MKEQAKSNPLAKPGNNMQTIEKDLYYKPDLDARLQQELQHFDREVSLNAENNGLRNKPSLSDPSVKSYFAEHHHKARALLGGIATELQPTVLISEVIESEKAMERKLQDLHNKLAAIREKTGDCEKEVKGNLRPYSKWRMPLAWFAICVPLFGDGLLNLPAFEMFGYNFIEALGMSTILAASLAVLAHTFDRIVALGKTVWQRRAIAGAILAILISLFYYLAAARAQYLSNEASANAPGGTSIHFSAMPLALFSVLLFVVAVAVNRFFFPDAEQRKAMREYEERAKKQQINADELKRVEEQIEAIKLQHESLIQTNGSIYVYGGKTEEMIIAHAHIGYSKWQRVNMMHRPDNGRPVGFDSDEYPFIFHRNFKPIEF